jgi:hypothetical protein
MKNKSGYAILGIINLCLLALLLFGCGNKNESVEANQVIEETKTDIEQAETETITDQEEAEADIEQEETVYVDKMHELTKNSEYFVNDPDAPIVYFTSDISAEGMLKIYKQLGWEPNGKVAVKLSTGEPPASYYLDPSLIKDVVGSVNGTIVECNTAYGGSRGEAAMHYQVAKDHGFTDIADFKILDENGSKSLPVTGGNVLKENLVGASFSDYDSYLVLSHFKGHEMAGFGGAIKNISIGLASREGKCLIHTGGKSNTSPWGGNQEAFTESMAEAGKSVCDYLSNGKNIAFINVLNNISIDCDCNGHPQQPEIHDIGIVASMDPVAIDQACIDLAFAAEGSESLRRRVIALDGLHTLEHAEEISLGSRKYRLVSIDE